MISIRFTPCLQVAQADAADTADAAGCTQAQAGVLAAVVAVRAKEDSDIPDTSDTGTTRRLWRGSKPRASYSAANPPAASPRIMEDKQKASANGQPNNPAQYTKPVVHLLDSLSI